MRKVELILQIHFTMDILEQFRDEISRTDYSSLDKENIDVSFANHSGIVHINEIIEKYLSSFTDEYFFEYSLLSSTINPSTSELYSFAAVSSPNPSFKTNVEKYVNPIILSLFPSEEEGVDKIELLSRNWFHNPELFLFPTINRIEPYICKKNDCNGVGDVIPAEPGYYFGITLSNGKTLHVHNMSYPRRLGEMLKASGLITARLNNQKSLIDNYHDGAYELKRYYNKYVRSSQNENYWYVTFPLLSAKDSYLAKYYKACYLKECKKHLKGSNSLTTCEEYIDKSEHVPGIGHFFIYFKLNDNIDELALQDAIKKLFVETNHFVGFISNNYTYATGLALLEKAMRESIKSAKAAIMSRNISHNLGSHVMAYMKHDLSSVEDMLNNGVLKEACPSDGFPKTAINKKELPYLVGLGRFISYLQERQDYIATVSTDFIPYPSIVNFKDSIYDELNPDYRFQRHDKWEGHKPANILLENIAKSEGLSRKRLDGNLVQDENNIIIKYGEFDGLNYEGNKDYDKLRDWNFSLPGGIMGRQAIFSIVENVIRNAAKHGSRKTGSNLIVSFDIIDPMTDMVKDERYSLAEDIRDLYIVKLTTNTSIKEMGFNKIQDALKDSLVGDNGQLKQSNKGIKEMQISAAWLRGIKIEDLDDEQIANKAPILEAHLENNMLQYVFCLPKVKEVAMITNRFTYDDDLSEDTKQLMKKKGWYIFTVDDYIQYTNKDFSFVLIDPEIWENDAEEIKEDRVTGKETTQNKRRESDKYRIKVISHNRYFAAASQTNLNQHLIKTDIFEKFKDFKTSKCFDDAVLNLYAQMADLSTDDIIAIHDMEGNDMEGNNKEAMDALLKNKESERIVLLDDQANNNYKYIYRKHNDTADQFRQFVGLYGRAKFYHELKFVEGITGGNSTDRLVRRMKLDDLWVYKHLHAMKTRVAIFDERIFTRVTGYEMTDLTQATVDIKHWSFDGLNLNDAKKRLYDYDLVHNQVINDDVYDEYESLKSINEVIQFADRIYPLSSTANEIDSIQSMVFHKKGIDVFTLIWDKDRIFNIWGFVPEENHKDGRFGTIKNVGQLDLDLLKAGKCPIKLDNKLDVPYDYLSIHQGLLDKVYEMFVSDKKNKDNVAAMKMNVTKALHDAYMVPCAGNDYLQGLIIHSGRSKPNEENMPQHQPFVQYSAIENAVFDCKYTLVELMDFACFQED